MSAGSDGDSAVRGLLGTRLTSADMCMGLLVHHGHACKNEHFSPSCTHGVTGECAMVKDGARGQTSSIRSSRLITGEVPSLLFILPEQSSECYSIPKSGVVSDFVRSGSLLGGKVRPGG